MLVQKKQKLLKRWRKYNDLELISQKEKDIKNDKVRAIYFLISNKTFSKLQETTFHTYDLSQYEKINCNSDINFNYDLKNGIDNYTFLVKYIETKKLIKINEKAYLQLHCYDAYRFSNYIFSGKNLIFDFFDFTKKEYDVCK